MPGAQRGMTLLAVIAVGCALVSTGLALRREIRRGPQIQEVPLQVPVPDAGRFDVGGHVIGAVAPALRIVMFSDFECPFCAQAALGVLADLRNRYPNEFAIRYREMPGARHRFAMPAARAAECAARQGRFTEMHDALYRHQDSLGLKTWLSFAREAGVPDTSVFLACTLSTEDIPGMDDDLRAVGELGARGTPTFIVDGMMYTGVPEREFLERSVLEAIQGRQQ